MNLHVQHIKKNHKNFVILPECEFDALIEHLEELEDVRDVKKSRANKEERFPAEVVFRILDGENPVKVFREYRNLTQQALADMAKITRNYLSMLEVGKREGTRKVLAAIAQALDVSMDDLS